MNKESKNKDSFQENQKDIRFQKRSKQKVNSSVDLDLSSTELVQLFKYTSDLEARLWNYTRFLATALVTFFIISGIVSEICSVFTSLRCQEVITSNLVTSQLICSITIAVIELGLVFLYAWDTKALKKTMSSAMKRIQINPESLMSMLKNSKNEKFNKESK